MGSQPERFRIKALLNSILDYRKNPLPLRRFGINLAFGYQALIA
jgi:hypothetical protein